MVAIPTAIPWAPFTIRFGKRDGSTVEVNLQNIRISEPGDDMSRFTFDTGALDPAIWIVNDLR